MTATLSLRPEIKIRMIDKNEIADFVNSRLADSDYFLVEVKVSPANDIEVTVDSPEGVDIDHCVELSRAIEENFDREKEDYSLQVGSAGLTEPLKVRRQYEMHLGDNMEVLAADGKKYRGTLDSLDDTGFTLIIAEKVKAEGEKKAHFEDVPRHFDFDKIKYTKYMLEF